MTATEKEKTLYRKPAQVSSKNVDHAVYRIAKRYGKEDSDMSRPAKILIYGAGVIGCLYAALLAKSGEDVTILARGHRLAALRGDGLRYFKNRQIHSADIQIIESLVPDAWYDYIFLTVRADQLHRALAELKTNISPTIVTMVNSIEDYGVWEALCGSGRVLPAFPGAGGGWKDDVLDAALTPGIIQPTTFGEIDGKKTPRVLRLKAILQGAGIPCQIVADMHLWQLCHLAMVIPLADAYYLTKGDAKRVYRDKRVMAQTVLDLQRNFKMLKSGYGGVSPQKINVFLIAPSGLLRWILPMVYKSKFGDKFMYQHAMKAPEEMAQLREEFYSNNLF